MILCARAAWICEIHEAVPVIILPVLTTRSRPAFTVEEKDAAKVRAVDRAVAVVIDSIEAFRVLPLIEAEWREAT